jgi:hypothetical protein
MNIGFVLSSSNQSTTEPPVVDWSKLRAAIHTDVPRCAEWENGATFPCVPFHVVEAYKSDTEWWSSLGPMEGEHVLSCFKYEAATVDLVGVGYGMMFVQSHRGRTLQMTWQPLRMDI